ncbi:MAG: sigma-70 family RNA polymerase sigma factor [Eubacteriales bacterium]|nr:sigma-70 family RNA polymerase sigma factor [Eubacteriales bacterium]
MTDKESFCENIRLYEKSMYRVALSVVKNETDAEEVISESIYRAYKSRDSLKSESAFKPWILRIVHNTAVEMIRQNSKIIPTDQPPEEIYENGEKDITTKLALRDAVNSLNQPYRTVIVLFYYENLSVSKIAQITSTSPIAVRKQLSRGRKMLRELLKEDFNN